MSIKTLIFFLSKSCANTGINSFTGIYLIRILKEGNNAQPGTQILQKKTEKEIQIMQNKCIRFCLRLDKMQHISLTEFRLINWFPTKERVHQCINAITFNFVNKHCPFYLNEIFEFSRHCRTDTRNSFAKLKHPFRKTNTGQKTLSYIFPSL